METTLFVGIQFFLMRICLMKRGLFPFKIEKSASWDQGRLHPSKFNGRIDPLKKPLGRKRLIWKKDTHTCLQIQVLLFALVFLLVIVRGRTMGKLVSIVTTCLVVLSSRVYSGSNCQGRWIPRRTVMGTTDRRGCVVPKHLESKKFGYWEQLSELRDDMEGRNIMATTDRHRPFREIESLNFVTTQQDGPSQARWPVTDSVTLTGSDFC